MRIPEEKIKEIIKLYTIDNLSINKITTIAKISFQSVVNILRNNNISIRHQNDHIINNYPEIEKLYQSGESLIKISKRFNSTKEAIARILKEHNIQILNRQNIPKFNENIFDSIDTEDKAYWLGFLYADGCVSSKLNTIEIALQKSDENHLRKFLKFIEHQNQTLIHYKKVNESDICRIHITNKHLKNILISYGCIPNKSLVLKFPDKSIFKSEDLIRHFIRGYFDGDGCISYIKYNVQNNIKVSPVCSLISTSNFIENTQKYLSINNIDSKISHDKRHHVDTMTLNFYQKQSRKLLKFLYENCNIYLDRKYKRAIFFKEFCRSLKEFNELLSSEIGESCDANPEVISEIAKGSETP